MNKTKQAGIDWSKKDMYEGIGRPDLKPRENKMKKLKKELRENITYLVRRAVERSLLVGKEPAIANYSKNLISLFDQALQAKEEEMVEKFSEFCHTKYKGCSQASGEWEYSYEGEVITMAEEFLSSLKKGETK